MKTCLFVLLLACGQLPAGKATDDTYVPHVGDRAILYATNEKGHPLPVVWVARSPAAMEDFLEMSLVNKARTLDDRVRVTQVRIRTAITVEEIVLIRDRATDGRLMVPLCKVRENPPDGKPWYVMADNVVRFRD